MLVLGEATAHLDPVAEREVGALVQGLGEEVTVVTVAHRAAAVAASGRPIDVGAPAQGGARRPPTGA